MPKWLANLPSNYTAQMALMGWFLTLTSKMTGYTIPGVGVAPGGIIEQQTDAIAHYLMDMETLADAMAVKKSWDRPQYAMPCPQHVRRSDIFRHVAKYAITTLNKDSLVENQY